MGPMTGKLQNEIWILALSIDVKFGACQFWGMCLNCCGVQAIFCYIVHTNSPTAPIWNIFNGGKFVLEKNIIATKMKENGWVVGVLWGFEPFSHGNYHNRVYMHQVCLMQSISARKATHIKLDTCSGSSQCQLHFGTKLVLIGWSGCEWLPFECKNAHFQAFPPLAPSGKTSPFWGSDNPLWVFNNQFLGYKNPRVHSQS